MEEITQYLHELNPVSITLRLLMATAFGGVIGMERGRKRRPAGLRTFALVCIGAALAMITNHYIFEEFDTGDASRMAAQVISGVGFLGAGTIIVTGRQQVKGLTTAAGLWAAASMGLAIGAGFYSGAILGFLFIMLSVTVLHSLDEKINDNGRVITLYMEVHQTESLSLLLDHVRRSGYRISSFEKQKTKTIVENDVAILLEMDIKKSQNHSQIISELSVIDGVHYVEELK